MRQPSPADVHAIGVESPFDWPLQDNCNGSMEIY
jgi:hypothetical protein